MSLSIQQLLSHLFSVMQLLSQGNYVMATICFERANDAYWEKVAKAFGLRADAEQLHGLNSEMASNAWRQAAEIFDAIGKAEHAADCFYMSKDYVKAGIIPFPLFIPCL